MYYIIVELLTTQNVSYSLVIILHACTLYNVAVAEAEATHMQAFMSLKHRYYFWQKRVVSLLSSITHIILAFGIRVPGYH